MKKIGILLFIYACGVSCSGNKKNDSTDSLQGVESEIINKKDSAYRLAHLLSDFTDTTTEFKNIKPRVGMSEQWPFLDVSDSTHLLTIFYYPNGVPMSISVEYKITGIQSVRSFYKNEQLQSSYRTVGGTYIDTALYFSEKGTLDSLVDHNKKFKISYYDAIDRAKKRGWKQEKFSITLVNSDNETFWQVAYCMTKDCSKNIWLRIDTKSGKETISKTGIYNLSCS